MSNWRLHRAHRSSRASSIAPPGGEGRTIRDHRAILHSESYASADPGAASDVTGKSTGSEAASASSPTPIQLQPLSDVIAGRTATLDVTEPGGADFTAVTDETLTIPAGDTTATFSIATANDATDEEWQTCQE